VLRDSNSCGAIFFTFSSPWQPSSVFISQSIVACGGVEGLYRQKQSREAGLERVKTTARQIIDDPVTSDKHRVRETLSELQEKWQDLSDRLVQMISYTVSSICTVLLYTLLDSSELSIITFWFQRC